MTSAAAQNLSIYLHWPFCQSKCPYCDFFSRVKKNIDQEAVISGWLQQLERYAEILPKRRIISVFFGGGTPSLIKPQNISRVLEKISGLWPVDGNIEVSLEANPNTRTPNLFADLAAAGINRLSLGIQSLDDHELKFLGRTHSAAEARQAVNDVLHCFDNHSADFIYALPGQEPEAWKQRVAEIASLGFKHLSLYQLTIEENTPFYRKGVKPADEENAAAMYRLSETALAAAGYAKYEVSNYARPGFQSVHNNVYWQGGDYIGIGETAHGRLRKDGRFYAVTNPLQFEELTAAERAEELVIMGLRLTAGIDKKRFYDCCGLNFDAFINQDFKQQALAAGLLQETSAVLKATAEGFLLLDYLISGLCG